MTSRNKDRVFANTKMMLDRATAGLDDIKSGDPKRRQSGLMNMITFGRSVTLTLQTLKSVRTIAREVV